MLVSVDQWSYIRFQTFHSPAHPHFCSSISRVWIQNARSTETGRSPRIKMGKLFSLTWSLWWSLDLQVRWEAFTLSPKDSHGQWLVSRSKVSLQFLTDREGDVAHRFLLDLYRFSVLCGLLRIDNPFILFRELLTNLLASKSQFSKLKASWIVSLWHPRKSQQNMNMHKTSLPKEGMWVWNS